MWGHIRQETREINGNIVTHGPMYDDRLNTTQAINVIEIFNTLEELKTYLATNYPGQDVKVFELTPTIASQKITFEPMKEPVYRGGGHGTKI
jgi:hypothetical protein